MRSIRYLEVNKPEEKRQARSESERTNLLRQRRNAHLGIRFLKPNRPRQAGVYYNSKNTLPLENEHTNPLRSHRNAHRGMKAKIRRLPTWSRDANPRSGPEEATENYSVGIDHRRQRECLRSHQTTAEGRDSRTQTLDLKKVKVDRKTKHGSEELNDTLRPEVPYSAGTTTTP